MSDHEYVPIGPAMRCLSAQIAEGAIDVRTLPLPPQEGTVDEQMAALRPQLYVMAGLITPLAVDRLVDHTATDSPRARANSSFAQVNAYFEEARYETVRTLTVPRNQIPVAERLETLVEMARAISPEHQTRYESGREFIGAGLTTATEMSIGALFGIHSLARVRRPTQFGPEDYIDVSARSYRLVTSIASHNISQINAIRRVLIASQYELKPDKAGNLAPCFNPNLLTLRPNHDDMQAYTDYIQPLDDMIDPRGSGGRIGDIVPKQGATLTCPALPDGVIKAFWNHITVHAANAKFKARHR